MSIKIHKAIGVDEGHIKDNIFNLAIGPLHSHHVGGHRYQQVRQQVPQVAAGL